MCSFLTNLKLTNNSIIITYRSNFLWGRKLIIIFYRGVWLTNMTINPVLNRSIRFLSSLSRCPRAQLRDTETFRFQKESKQPTVTISKRDLLIVTKIYTKCLIRIYLFLINYIIAQKMTEWNSGNVSTESRGVELFKHLHNMNMNHVNFPYNYWIYFMSSRH